MATKYSMASTKIVETAKKIPGSDPEAIANALMEKEPLRQYKALQDGLGGLFDDAKKTELRQTYHDVLAQDVPTDVKVDRQQWYVRNLADKVVEIVTKEFPSEPVTPDPAEGTMPEGTPLASGSPTTQGGTSPDTSPPTSEGGDKPGTGTASGSPDQPARRRLMGIQRLYAAFAPRLRDLLIDARLQEACSVLTPPVNFMDKRYPRTQDEAEALTKGHRNQVYKDLERAVCELLKRPSLDQALSLRRKLEDVQLRQCVERFLGFIPESIRPAVNQLLETERSFDRLRLMMLDKKITNVVVATGINAYETLIRTDAQTQPVPIPLAQPQLPTVEVAAANPQPAPAGESGPQPILPHRQPSNQPFPFGTRPGQHQQPQNPGNQGGRGEPMNANNQPAGGAQNANPAAQNPATANPAPATQPGTPAAGQAQPGTEAAAPKADATATLMQELLAARKEAGDAKKAKEEAEKRLADVKAEAANSARVAKQPGLTGGQLGWAIVAVVVTLVAIFIVGPIATRNVGGGSTAQPPQGQQTQQQPSDLPPIAKWDEVGNTSAQQ